MTKRDANKLIKLAEKEINEWTKFRDNMKKMLFEKELAEKSKFKKVKK